MTKQVDFKALSGPALVSTYNEMVATAIDLGINTATTTKRFGDRGAGIIRCERLHSEIQQALAKAGATDEQHAAKIAETPTFGPTPGVNTAAPAAQPGDTAAAAPTTEGADDMAKKAKGSKKGGTRAKSTDGTSIREMTEQYNDIVKGMSAALRKEVKFAKHHSSQFESKEKAKKQLKRLNDAIKKAG